MLARPLLGRDFNWSSNKVHVAGGVQSKPAIYEVPVSEPIKNLFKRWFNDWKAETITVSSITDIFANENYRRILGLGRSAVGPILDELQNDPSIRLLTALREITGENPTPREQRSSLQGIADCWLEWGKKHKYI